jgi:hypothetical protein
MAYTIWRNNYIVGTYPGATELEALDNLAKDEGFLDFSESNTKKQLTRDNYRVKEVKE